MDLVILVVDLLILVDLVKLLVKDHINIFFGRCYFCSGECWVIIVVHSDGMADHDRCLSCYCSATCEHNQHHRDTRDHRILTYLDNEEHKVVIEKMVGTPSALSYDHVGLFRGYSHLWTAPAICWLKFFGTQCVWTQMLM